MGFGRPSDATRMFLSYILFNEMTSRESKVQLVDMYSLSDTKPVSDGNTYIISRDPLLDLFDSQFEEEKVLCVTGEEGVGVTTTLNMFAEKHRSSCASYFYNGWSRHLLSPQAIAYSLLKQLSWYTKQDFNVDFDGSSLSSCVYKLSRASKNKAKYLYFVFDGFNRLPLEYLDGIKHLISPLFGIDNVRFIFSGTLEQ